MHRTNDQHNPSAIHFILVYRNELSVHSTGHDKNHLIPLGVVALIRQVVLRAVCAMHTIAPGKLLLGQI